MQRYCPASSNCTLRMMRLLLGATMKRGGLSWEKSLVHETSAGGVLGGGLQGIVTSRDRIASVSGGGSTKSVSMPALGGAEEEGYSSTGWPRVAATRVLTQTHWQW